MMIPWGMANENLSLLGVGPSVGPTVAPFRKSLVNMGSMLGAIFASLLLKLSTDEVISPSNAALDAVNVRTSCPASRQSRLVTPLSILSGALLPRTTELSLRNRVPQLQGDYIMLRACPARFWGVACCDTNRGPAVHHHKRVYALCRLAVHW